MMIVEMLVIDRIEEIVLQHLFEITDLETEQAVRLEQGMDVGERRGEIIDVRKNVVAGDEISGAVFDLDPLNRVGIEKGVDGIDAVFVSDLRGQRGRIDTADPKTPRLERLQAGSVIRSDIHDNRVFRQAAAGDHPRRIGVKMLDEARPDPAEIGVVGCVELFRRHRVTELKMAAFGAAIEIERVARRRTAILRVPAIKKISPAYP